MAPKNEILITIFPLFFLSLHHMISWSNASPSNTNTPQKDYEEWLKWNIQNHHEKKLNLMKPNAGLSLDVNLQNAEIDKVRLSINQDGTGDYKTIMEALDNIPIHNARRVILQITPGVYR